MTYSEAIKLATADCIDTFYEEGSEAAVNQLVEVAEDISVEFDLDYEVVLEDLSEAVEDAV